MDPVTARPRETPMQSLTVVADSVMHADVATTALFGLGESTIVAALARRLPNAELARAL
jgi:thiamine biosynthesis lipoprotein ApbE